MFIDSRELTNGALIEADLCIVGAGAAGITLAREFAAHTLQVAVIESGGFESEKETQALYQGSVTGFPYESLDTMRLRYFGGSTNHWAGNCRPLDEADFLQRPWLPYSGWPFTRDILIPYYQRAQAVAGLQAFDYDVASWSDSGKLRTFEFDPAKLITGIKQKSKPVRFGTAYRSELDRAKNLGIYLHGNLADIESNDSASHVSGLRCHCLTGTSFRVVAQTYVLATGGIENARLLLASDKVQQGGLGNHFDLVGRFFMEHPHGGAGSVVVSDRFTLVQLYRETIIRNARVKAVITLSPELLAGEKLSNIYFNLGVELSRSKGEQSASKILKNARKWKLPDDLGTHIGNVIADLDEVAAAAYHRMTDDADPIGRINVHCRVEPVPDPDSRVTLRGQPGRLGIRQVDLAWNPGALALKSFTRGVEVLAMEVGRIGLGRMNISPPRDNGWPRGFSVSGHHIGTTRMHERPDLGVVNPDCRVHGIDNLYIAGSSVFPTAGCNNPTLTIVALALRLADHLKARA